ncbi:MAG: hypothetical protein H6619_02765 [Deltaproteobacteria bacterium]|nr:hypothetical protein [Deltaproteobacteria bacterium]
MKKAVIPIRFDSSAFQGKDKVELTIAESHSVLLSSGIALVLFALLSGNLYFWEASPSSPFISSKSVLIFGAILSALAIVLNRFRLRGLAIIPEPFAACLLMVFFTSWLDRGFSLLQGPSIRGEIILGALFALYFVKKKILSAFTAFAFISIILLPTFFFQEAAGRLLFSDDHATFLYRLSLLKDNFPAIPFYNPLWNAGFDARDFFATGALNIFLLFSPIIYAFELTSVYNIIIALILFVLVPGATWYAAKLDKASHLSRAVAGLLTLTTSLLWYRWALKYGTMGFITSLSLIPLNLMLVGKLLSEEKSDFVAKDAILFGITFTLMLLWSASGLVFVPAIGLGLYYFKIAWAKRSVPYLLVALLAVNLSWITVFFTASKIGSFLVSESTEFPDQANAEKTSHVQGEKKLFKMRKQDLSAENAIKHLREQAASANPLLLLLGLPGLFLIRNRSSKRVYLATAAWLFVCGAILYPLKPQLELDRMLLMLLLCLAIPTAYSIEHILKGESKFHLILGLIVCGFLFAAPLSVSSIVRNRTLDKYNFATPLVENLTNAIVENSDGAGRTFFTGFVLQDISGGHAGPLSYFTNVPLYACDFAHKHWWYTDVIPDSYRTRGDAGIDEYLNLANATSVIAHEKPWREYLESRPDAFEKVWSYENFALFKRKNYQGNYFMEGAGEIINQTNNAITLKVAQDSAIIKFTYFPFLTSDNCKLEPYKVNRGTTYIKLSACTPNRSFKIHSVSTVDRLLQSIGN